MEIVEIAGDREKTKLIDTYFAYFFSQKRKMFNLAKREKNDKAKGQLSRRNKGMVWECLVL